MRDYLTAMAMGVGTFEMAPLSDFVVKETKVRRTDLPRMEWEEWREKVGMQDGEKPDYDVEYGKRTASGKRLITMKQKKPYDFDVQLSDDDAASYELEWQPD